MNTTSRATAAPSNHFQAPDFVPTEFDRKIIAMNQASNKLSFGKIVLIALFVGPLVGGLPYIWTIIAIPFAYLLGAAPALIGGICFALWFRSSVEPKSTLPTAPQIAPSASEGAAFGALFGAVGCAISCIGLVFLSAPPDSLESARGAIESALYGGQNREWLLVLPHGVFAGFMLGGYFAHYENKKIRRRAKPEGKTS